MRLPNAVYPYLRAAPKNRKAPIFQDFICNLLNLLKFDVDAYQGSGILLPQLAVPLNDLPGVIRLNAMGDKTAVLLQQLDRGFEQMHQQLRRLRRSENFSRLHHFGLQAEVIVTYEKQSSQKIFVQRLQKLLHDFLLVALEISPDQLHRVGVLLCPRVVPKIASSIRIIQTFFVNVLLETSLQILLKLGVHDRWRQVNHLGAQRSHNISVNEISIDTNWNYGFVITR